MKKSKLVKILKIGGIVIAIILLLLAGAMIYLNQNVEKMARKLIEKEYQGSEMSKVYAIQFDAVRLNLFSGRLVIKNLHLSPHEAFFKAPDSLRFQHPMLFDIEVPKLAIKGISQNISLPLADLQLEEIIFTQPKVTLIDHLTASEKKQAKAENNSQKRDTTAKAGVIESFSLNALQVDGAQFTYFNKVQDRVVAKAEETDLEFQNLKYRKDQDLKSLIPTIIEDAHVDIAGIVFYPESGFYAIQVDELQNQGDLKSVLLNTIKVIPQYPKPEFAKKFGKQTDRMEVEVASLKIQDFDWERFILKNEIIIQNIVVSHLYLNAYRDKNVDLDPNHFPKLPQQALASLSMAVAIDKIEVKDSEVLYEQLTAGAEEVGQAPVSSIYGTLTFISNMPDYIAARGAMRWDLQGRVFDAGLLKLQVLFPQNIRQAGFSFSGSMGTMDMTAFNQILINAEDIKIEQGFIHDLSFEAKANKDFAEGTLQMRYDSLKIGGLANVRAREKEDFGLLAALANAVIRKFNPPAKSTKEAKVSEIFFERNKNKGVFNYLVKSLVSGVKATIIPSIISPRKQYDREQSREDRKQERHERKQERKENRDDRKDKDQSFWSVY